MAAVKYERALLFTSYSASASADDDTTAHILEAYARCICSLLRNAEVTSSTRRWQVEVSATASAEAPLYRVSERLSLPLSPLPWTL